MHPSVQYSWQLNMDIFFSLDNHIGLYFKGKELVKLASLFAKTTFDTELALSMTELANLDSVGLR